jgi:phage-related protein
VQRQRRIHAIVLSSIAIVVFMLAASESFAEAKRPTRETMLNRCDWHFVNCTDECDKAPNTTPKKFKDCNDNCDARWKKCYRRVDEVRPERTTGGGGDTSSGGVVLDPGAGDPPPPSFNPKPYSVPGGGVLSK